MNYRLYILAIVALAVGCTTSKPATLQQPVVPSFAVGKTDPYEACIQTFASGTPTEVSAAIEFIELSGTDSFDALLSHLDDRTRTLDGHFMRAAVTIDESGNASPFKPTIASACFDILQGQIEGVWPKGYREYYILSRSNIQEWIAERRHKTLTELKTEAATLSLKSAKLKQSQSPTDWTESCVGFLTENLAEVRAAN